MKQNLIKTKDGSHTIYLPEMDEQYHSVNGALTESQHVYINSGYLAHNSKETTVLEIGFGTGLNCLLTALEAEKRCVKTTYITIDKYPLEPGMISQLNYSDMLGRNAAGYFKKIHEAPWEVESVISELFNLRKINLDITSQQFPDDIFADIIYFDAFGPDKQPEMWSEHILKKTTDTLNPNGIFVTYSVKGLIKRSLQASGFTIEKLPGPPGKKEILRGIKNKF